MRVSTYVVIDQNSADRLLRMGRFQQASRVLVKAILASLNVGEVRHATASDGRKAVVGVAAVLNAFLDYFCTVLMSAISIHPEEMIGDI